MVVASLNQKRSPVKVSEIRSQGSLEASMVILFDLCVSLVGKAGIALFFFSSSGFKALYAWLLKYIKTNLNHHLKHPCAQ